jgi:hypothetical protein
LGGLKPATRRLLERVAQGGGSDRPDRRSVTAAAGTVLVREWRGKPHQATMIDGGVIYQGECYRSLSAVARAITGAHWSGPLFFGLRVRTRARCDGTG